LLLLLLAVVVSGCDTAAPTPTAAPTLELGTAFNEPACGTITGTVLWSGEQPQVAPFLSPPNPLANPSGVAKRSWPNPHLPLVDPATQGVRDAVVYLRTVESAKSRKWEHPPVRVEFRDDDMYVVQGEYDERRGIGIVQRGQSFTVVSKQDAFESLQARGAAFFNLTLPDTEMSRARRLDRAGVVELSSGVGRFWMRGHLFVAEHPYYARTDKFGRFTLPKVPAGDYELVCWHPNWHEDVREHDADTLCITRVTFQPAAEQVQSISIRPGQTADKVFMLSLKDFAH
jgi:hypothetical protein